MDCLALNMKRYIHFYKLARWKADPAISSTGDYSRVPGRRNQDCQGDGRAIALATEQLEETNQIVAPGVPKAGSEVQ